MGQVIRVQRCQLSAGQGCWDWPETHAAAIEEHWTRIRQAKPAYFDGPVYVLGPWSVADDVLRAEFVATQFRKYIYWRSQGQPETGVRDGFGSALIRSSEGHVVLGRQRDGNLNAGLAYLPGGFVDPSDVGADDSIDIDASVAREVEEETGLGRDQLHREPGYFVIVAEPLVSITCPYRSPLGSEDLARQMRAHISQDPASELTEPVIIRGGDYRRDDVPKYTLVLLDWLFQSY
jgi:8-oxo-dGTP pyrophosphatase MutT (NUDIX family)